jgi:hypothetical protein
MVDKLEKVGRTALWFALAAACMLGVLGFVVTQREAVAAAASLQQAAELRAKHDEEKSVREDPKVKRLKLSSMGSVLQALDSNNATGTLLFTNVSPREGVVCVVGIATNETTGQKAESLAACEPVNAYATASIKVKFAGAELSEVCKGVRCSFGARDEPDAHE